MGDDGYRLYGAHLQSFAPGLRTGAHVDAGTVLGFVGNTGDASEEPPPALPALPAGHAWGSPVDPKSWLDDMLNRAISTPVASCPSRVEAPAPQAAPGVNVGAS